MTTTEAPTHIWISAWRYGPECHVRAMCGERMHHAAPETAVLMLRLDASVATCEACVDAWGHDKLDDES